MRGPWSRRHRIHEVRGHERRPMHQALERCRGNSIFSGSVRTNRKLLFRFALAAGGPLVDQASSKSSTHFTSPLSLAKQSEPKPEDHKTTSKKTDYPSRQWCCKANTKTLELCMDRSWSMKSSTKRKLRAKSNKPPPLARQLSIPLISDGNVPSRERPEPPASVGSLGFRMLAKS